jgi:signal peptidase II
MHPLLTNFRSPLAMVRFFATTALGLAVDLWTKAYAFRVLADGPPHAGKNGAIQVQSLQHVVIPDWLQFQITCNQGAVFGIGQGYRWPFVVISVLAIGFLTYLFAASGRQRFWQFILGLLLAGVLGNMYDRVALGYVRDMIYILPGIFIWPGRQAFPWIFNVADMMLCCGVGLMLIHTAMRRK